MGAFLVGGGLGRRERRLFLSEVVAAPSWTIGSETSSISLLCLSLLWSLYSLSHLSSGNNECDRLRDLAGLPHSTVDPFCPQGHPTRIPCAVHRGDRVSLESQHSHKIRLWIGQSFCLSRNQSEVKKVTSCIVWKEREVKQRRVVIEGNAIIKTRVPRRKNEFTDNRKWTTAQKTSVSS